MSWLLKQAEDILNKVDQQTNAAINQHQTKTTSKQSNDESISTSSSSNKSNLNINSTNRTTTTGNQRHKKNEEPDLFDYLNSSTPVNNKPNRTVPFNTSLSDTTRTVSSPNMYTDDPLKTTEQSLSKSVSGTPRSTTPPVQTHDEDEGLFLVR
jgi:hypothetical protein